MTVPKYPNLEFGRQTPEIKAENDRRESEYLSHPFVQQFVHRPAAARLFQVMQDYATGGGIAPLVKRLALPTVILSTPLGFSGGVFAMDDIPFPSDLTGMISYVSHSATRLLLEQLGATTDDSGGYQLVLDFRAQQEIYSSKADAIVALRKEIWSTFGTDAYDLKGYYIQGIPGKYPGPAENESFLAVSQDLQAILVTRISLQ